MTCEEKKKSKYDTETLTFYALMDSSLWFDTKQPSLSKIPNSSIIWAVGDFNLPHIDWDNRGGSRISQTQANDIPTQ